MPLNFVKLSKFVIHQWVGSNIPCSYNIGPNMPLFTKNGSFPTREHFPQGKRDKIAPELCKMIHPFGPVKVINDC